MQLDFLRSCAPGGLAADFKGSLGVVAVCVDEVLTFAKGPRKCKVRVLGQSAEVEAEMVFWCDRPAHFAKAGDTLLLWNAYWQRSEYNGKVTHQLSVSSATSAAMAPADVAAAFAAARSQVFEAARVYAAAPLSGKERSDSVVQVHVTTNQGIVGSFDMQLLELLDLSVHKGRRVDELEGVRVQVQGARVECRGRICSSRQNQMVGKPGESRGNAASLVGR